MQLSQLLAVLPKDELGPDRDKNRLPSKYHISSPCAPEASERMPHSWGHASSSLSSWPRKVGRRFRHVFPGRSIFFRLSWYRSSTRSSRNRVCTEFSVCTNNEATRSDFSNTKRVWSLPLEYYSTELPSYLWIFQGTRGEC